MTKIHTQIDASDTSQRLFAPCREKCPVHIDVPGYLTAIAEGRFTDALGIVIERNPLPSVCGRVCLRPCEEGCRRCLLDEPVAIAQLKRAAADFGAYPAVRKNRSRPETIAVVGGGPAGLTAAHDLAQRGFSVTIYESKPSLGGMLRYGIPNYRLPDYALDRDIDYILSLGIEVETGVRIGEDMTIDELRGKHDAVLVTVGLQGSRALPIPGVDGPNVLTALPFLEASSAGKEMDLGNRVVVVGGGNVAMDVARTARRHGATWVRAVCLESAEEMPATDEEIEEARQEGVSISCSWAPEAIIGAGGPCALQVKRCTSVFDATGRFSPSFDESVIEAFDADTIIFAIGQSAEVAGMGLPLTERGGIKIDPATLLTPVESVYAAGDVVAGPTKIIDAIAAGQRAAAVIMRDLIDNSSYLEELDEENTVLGEVPGHMASHIETHRRIRMETLEHFEAIQTLDEVELGYTEYEAAREAQRCLSCTTGARLAEEKCTSCLTCVRICPHGGAIIGADGRVHFDADACNACGACASQCPSQAISLEGFSEEDLAKRVERVLANAGMNTTLVFACGCTPILPELLGADARVITVTCLLRASERNVLEALQNGAARVMFAGCVESTCRFPHARDLVAQRQRKIIAALEDLRMEDAFVIEHETDDTELYHL